MLKIFHFILGNSIYRGVLTGYNNAFIIDNETKERLIDKDKNSAKIIKPVLRGRDIKRYQANWEKRWLITTFPSLRLDIDDYPAVKEWLREFLPKLHQTGKLISSNEKQCLMRRITSLGLNPREKDLNKCRKKTPHSWFELQDTCAYHAEFEKEKVVWSDIATEPKFQVFGDGFYCFNNTTYMMTGTNLKYIGGVLNSSLIKFYFPMISTGLGGSGSRFFKQFVEKLPIPLITSHNQSKIEQINNLVEKILSAKQINSNFDTTELEAQIDQIVYSIYDLTAEQIKFIKSV